MKLERSGKCPVPGAVSRDLHRQLRALPGPLRRHVTLAARLAPSADMLEAPPGGSNCVIHAALTTEELVEFDAKRGALERSKYLRAAVYWYLQHLQQVPLQDADPDTWDLMVAQIRDHARSCQPCGRDMDEAEGILQRIQDRHLRGVA